MDKYYFLIAELPTLFFGKEPAITVEYFLAEAEKWMNEFSDRVPNDTRAKLFASSKGFYKNLSKDKGYFSIKNLFHAVLTSTWNSLASPHSFQQNYILQHYELC